MIYILPFEFPKQYLNEAETEDIFVLLVIAQSKQKNLPESQGCSCLTIAKYIFLKKAIIFIPYLAQAAIIYSTTILSINEKKCIIF